MNTFLFNINDLALLLQIAQCLMLTIILLLVRDKAGTGNGLLALLLVVFSLGAIDTLIYWNTPINTIVARWGVWPFWIIKWAPLAQGPILYFYIRTKLVGKEVSTHDWPHALPLLIYPFVVIALYWQLNQYDITQGYGLQASWKAGVYDYGEWFRQGAFKFLLWGMKLSALGYSLYTFWFLRKSAQALANSYSNAASVEPIWLRMVVLGFSGLWFTALLAGIAGELNWQLLSHTLSLLVNYLGFGFITSLVFYSLLKSYLAAPRASIEPTSKPETAPNVPSETDILAAHNLKKLLYEKALYLNPELTVEQLDNAAELPERYVSYLIKACLNSNFFEFVNVARVEKSKQILRTTSQPILDVIFEAGFNSKATFNRIFKRYNDMTPTEYRKNQAALK